jgi:hypothetical protein
VIRHRKALDAGRRIYPAYLYHELGRDAHANMAKNGRLVRHSDGSNRSLSSNASVAPARPHQPHARSDTLTRPPCARVVVMPREAPARRGAKRALSALGAVVLAGALAQVLLPRIAASMISSRMAQYGKVQSVSMTAWPALKLLWGSADSVTVHARSLSLTATQAGKLLWEGRRVTDMSLSVARLQVGSLRITNVNLRKRDSSLAARALMSESDVKTALPPGVEVKLARSRGGKIELVASGGLFGTDTPVRAVAEVSEGKLVAHPLGFLVEGLTLTLFSAPHVYVQAVSVTRDGLRPPGYLLGLRASLR